MKNPLLRRLLLLVPLPVCLLAGGAASAQPVRYTLDPQHSFVHFEVQHFGTSTSRGRFGPLTGEVVLDTQAGSGALDITVATAGVDTGLAFFNTRLRQADMLASDEFPAARFVATGFVFDGGRVAEVVGDFSLRGVSRPLTLKALRFACRTAAESPSAGAEICGGDFEAEFYRSTYGMYYGWPFVANRVRLRVQVEAVRTPP